MEMLLSGDYTTLLAPGLLLVHLDNVVLLHLQGLRSLVIVDAAAVKEETDKIMSKAIYYYERMCLIQR